LNAELEEVGDTQQDKGLSKKKKKKKKKKPTA
jgi:hypothetical protein